MQHPRETALSAAFPFESRYVEVEGVRMHYIDEGEGDPILFLHGNPTSSYLWRNVIPHVKPRGRVIAVDNVGFGKSGKEPRNGYTFQDHYRYIEAFIAKLALRNLTLVIHDWGSVLGLFYAANHSDNVKAVAFMEAIVPPTFPMESIEGMGPNGQMFRAFRTPSEGRPLLIDQNLFIEGVLPGTILRKLSDAEMNVYRAPFLEPASREPLYVWPNELPIAGSPARNVDVVRKVGEWLAHSETPKLLLYTSPGALIPPEAAQWMAENYRNIDIRFVGYGIHFIQEDEPETIGRNIADWLGALNRRRSA